MSGGFGRGAADNQSYKGQKMNDTGVKRAPVLISLFFWENCEQIVNKVLQICVQRYILKARNEQLAFLEEDEK